MLKTAAFVAMLSVGVALGSALAQDLGPKPSGNSVASMQRGLVFAPETLPQPSVEKSVPHTTDSVRATTAPHAYPSRLITTPSQDFMFGRDRMQDFLDEFENRDDRSPDALMRKAWEAKPVKANGKPFQNWNLAPAAPLKF